MKNLIIAVLVVSNVVFAAILFSRRSIETSPSLPIEAKSTASQRVERVDKEPWPPSEKPPKKQEEQIPRAEVAKVTPVPISNETNAVLAMLGEADHATLALEQIKIMNRRQDSTLISRMKATPEGLAAFESLWAERTASVYDATEIARGKGLRPDQALLADIDRKFIEGVKSAVGVENAELVQDYVANPGVWSILRNYEESLARAGVDRLSDQQFTAMRAKIEEYRVRMPQPTDTAAITEYIDTMKGKRDALLVVSQSYLSPAQLRQLQAHTAEDIVLLKYNLTRRLRAKTTSKQ